MSDVITFAKRMNQLTLNSWSPEETTVAGVITTTLTPKTKKDIIGVVTYYPDAGEVYLDCCNGRNWEATKDFTGLTESIYLSHARDERTFQEKLERLASSPVAVFADSLMKDCLSIYGKPTDMVIRIPSAAYVIRSSFTPWDRFEENPNVVEWINLLNKHKAHVNRKWLIESAQITKPDPREFGVKCLDNVEMDACIWEAAINCLV